MSEAFIGYLTQFIDSSQIMLNEPMAKHTTFRTGGNAEALIRVTDKEQLSRLICYLDKVGRKFVVLGNGSNVLVGDKGYDGVIIQIGAGFDQIQVHGNRITAKAGALLSRVAQKAAEASLTGLEFASGIPGTIGGGVMMNAGAYDGEMKQVVESVTILDRQGTEMVLDFDTMEFGYRTSVLKRTGHIVTEVSLLLQPGDHDAIVGRMEELNQKRRDKQPLEYPSAGSTFKRPEGNFAGKMIMEAGLRGYRIGGACVSEKHCGFIINDRGATSGDVRQLIDYVIEQVSKQTGVRLQPEVIFLGDF